MINVCIIDDVEKTRKSVANIIQLYGKNIKIAGEADGVASGIKLITNCSPDVVLLDIEMPDGTAFDLLRKLKEIRFKIIFITAHEGYSLQAIKFSALDYILKPINPDDLIASIERAEDIIEKENASARINTFLNNLTTTAAKEKKIILKTFDSIHVICVADIIRCESDGNYTTFYLSNNTKLFVSRTLKEFDDMLKDYGFFRSHQSHLVNLDYLSSYKKSDGGFIVMKDLSEVPVSARNRNLLFQYIEKI